MVIISAVGDGYVTASIGLKSIFNSYEQNLIEPTLM